MNTTKQLTFIAIFFGTLAVLLWVLFMVDIVTDIRAVVSTHICQVAFTILAILKHNE
jgi:hypothetical protein